MVFNKAIEELLKIKNNLNAEKEQEILEAVQSIENKYVEVSIRVENALKACGYVEPQPVSEENSQEVVDSTVCSYETTY